MGKKSESDLKKRIVKMQAKTYTQKKSYSRRADEWDQKNVLKRTYV